MKRLLRLYPAAWRARYEAEVAELLDELPADRDLVLDLIRGAWVERARSVTLLVSAQPLPAGGTPMFAHPLQRHPTRLAVLALLLVLPTTTFVFLSVLAYELGVIGLQPVVGPVLEALPSLGLFNAFLQVAPALALLIAFAPLVGLGLSRPDGGLLVSMALQPRGLNLAVIALCLLVLGIAGAHHFVEVMLEAAL